MPLFGTNNSFNKTSNSFIGLNNNSILDAISNPNNFRNEIKLFNQVSQPKINFNIISPENKNILNNNSTNTINNFNNYIENKNNNIDKSNINSNNNKNNNLMRDEELKTNTISLPPCPSFFNDNKEYLKKNIENINNNILTNNNKLNENFIINPINNSINKVNNLINCKEPYKMNYFNNNSLNNYTESINRYFFPGLNQFSLLSSSLNNNIFTNPIIPINYNVMKIPQINNNIFEINKNDKKEGNVKEMNELIGKKRF